MSNAIHDSHRNQLFTESPNTPRLHSFQSPPGFPVKSGSYSPNQKASKESSLDVEYHGSTIPPSTKDRKKHRTLCLLFDGTGDQFDADNSNVVQLVSLLKKGDSKQQLVYYQAGIGTYTIPEIATPGVSKFRQTIDMMLGTSLNHHVMGGYEFLMENYRDGDRICIFGFSRGAYTARALAGMIEKVGLLPAGNHQQVPFAYKMYLQDDDEGWKQSCLFKKVFSMDVDIEFLGVWDTVASVGIIPKHVPFTKKNTCVKTFRHAISLDEHRVKFKANHFQEGSMAANRELEFQNEFTYTPIGQRLKNWADYISGWFGSTKSEDDNYNKSSKLQDRYTDQKKKTDVLEVWFSGCHTDIGGGSVPNDTRYSLARITMRWMIRQIFLSGCGIQFQADRLREVGMDPKALYPEVKPRPSALPVDSIVKSENREEHAGTIRCKHCTPSSPTLSQDDGTVVEDPVNEEHEDLHDALCQAYDQLELKWGWWLLELIPLIHLRLDKDGKAEKVVYVNGARPRVFKRAEGDKIKVHRSVKTRMEAECLSQKYKPRLQFDLESTEWVD